MGQHIPRKGVLTCFFFARDQVYRLMVRAQSNEAVQQKKIGNETVPKKRNAFYKTKGAGIPPQAKAWGLLPED